MIPTIPIEPLAGRLYRRAVKSGAAWVGVLELPASFVPVEGVAYAMAVDAESVSVLPDPLDVGLEKLPATRGRALDVGDVLTKPIWPKPIAPCTVPVRFIAAFPEHNRWTVYGPSPLPVPEQEPGHRWWDVRPCGRLAGIEPPMDAAGMGMGQVLTVKPVWPGPDGKSYTLPQTPATWRKTWLAYHELLASSVDNPKVAATLDERLATKFRELSFGRPDPAFCAYLARLREAGLLHEDAPLTADDLRQREEFVAETVSAMRRRARP